jgi:hypothetical protein
MMIRLCHINITSIKKYKDELLARFSDQDVISVNETNLEKDTPFFLKGYNIFRNDRVGRSGGGVLLAVKENIKSRVIYNQTIDDNEIVAIEIETKSFGNILIASIYVPPLTKIVPQVFRDLYQINNDCIMMGDLNAALEEMGSRKTNRKGKQLKDIFNEGYLIGIDDNNTTFERNHYEEKLDWVLASQPLFSFINDFEVQPSLGLSSGHKPIVYNLPIEAETKPPSPRLSYNFKSANWNKFRTQLDKQLKCWNNKQSSNLVDIEEYTTFITKCLTTATNEAVRTNTHRISTFSVSEATKRLIQLKHQAYRRWKKTAEQEDKQRYYNHKLLLTNSLRNDRRSYFKQLMSSLCQKQMYSDAVWLTVRKFHNKRIKQTYSGVMQYNNNTATTNAEKAELFAEYFEKEVYFEAEDVEPYHCHITHQTNIIRQNMHNNVGQTNWNEITTAEVKMHIKQLRNSSTGQDNVHNRCLKNYTELLVNHLTRLFNQILVQGYIPKAWKQANIILLLKPSKDQKSPSSYRPISLLSCLGKLLEKIIKSRLMLEVERRQILPQHQAGFRSKKSTMYNIVRLERYAKDNLIRSRHSAVIFFDIKAAFDSVWHDGLLYKLNDLKLPPYLTNYLMSFLGNRTANIEFENILSRPFNLKSGTPQGSPLSPILYILYTADSMNGIPDHTEHGLFADDTALWTSSNTTSSLSSRLQQSVVAFEKWCRCWKLKLQPTKTELIHFNVHPRRKYKNEVSVKVEDTMIIPKDSSRYLGVIIDKELKWNKHLQHIEKCVAPRISLLRYLSSAAQEANERIMINIFKSIVRTVMIYGHPVLLTANDKFWKRLQIIQNKAIRAALNLPHYTSTKYIHQLTNVPKVKEYATSRLQQMINTAINNNDVILRTNLEEILCQV